MYVDRVVDVGFVFCITLAEEVADGGLEVVGDEIVDDGVYVVVEVVEGYGYVVDYKVGLAWYVGL